jgi:hypothetical protein
VKRVGSVGLWLGVVAWVVTGCGGSDGGDGTEATPSESAAASSQTTVDVSVPSTDPSAVTIPTTTSVLATSAVVSTSPQGDPTTTVDTRPIDAADQALALAATLQAASFPAPWTVFAEGEPTSVSEESCSYRQDGAVTLLTNGASQSGPTMQLGETGAYVYSTGLAFPDEALAMEYIGVINTDVWATCRAEQLQQFQQDNGSDSVVKIESRESPNLNQAGFESYIDFAITLPDGTLDRVATQSYYRLGRTVIAQTIEYGALSEADLTKMVEDTYVALSDAYDRVNALAS